MKRDVQFHKPYPIAKSLKYELNSLSLQASNLAPKMGRQRSAWQLARSLSSVAR